MYLKYNKKKLNTKSENEFFSLKVIISENFKFKKYSFTLT